MAFDLDCPALQHITTGTLHSRYDVILAIFTL
jgi:hypothetical protein